MSINSQIWLNYIELVYKMPHPSRVSIIRSNYFYNIQSKLITYQAKKSRLQTIFQNEFLKLIPKENDN